MKKVSVAIRSLSFIIDYIIVIAPIQIIMVMYFGISESQAELLFKLLFAVYGALFMEYMKGATIGKRFGKILVMKGDGSKPSLFEYGMRELLKSLYFVPMFGWILALISLLMVIIGDGKAIHDRVADTKVIYVWHKEEPKQDEL